ncbi:MAG: precorrin-8X methylmutase [Cyanobacteria bacterium J06635_11]
MPPYREHDITLASFEQIDREIGDHTFTEAEYALVRRVIHTSADFEFKQLVQFKHGPFPAAAKALGVKSPIVTDVSMVAAGIKTVVAKTWGSPIAIAVKQQQPSASAVLETRSAYGMRQCAHQYPKAIFAVGNAPTALLALCESIEKGDCQPALVIGAPVGFINVVESKQALSALQVPHIVITGRKGGSAIAAAMLNALMIQAWETSTPPN